MSRNYTITVCGASRVGKSTLINALVGKEVAKTSSSLQPCTTIVQKYVLERYGESTDGPITYHIEFWDTPGVETWSENHVRSFFSNIIEQTNPICMIYCASPNSFADIRQVTWFVETCINREIFVALVCTNMFAGSELNQIMKNFTDLLDRLRLPAYRHEDNNIVYYGRKALCTKVNSRQFLDKTFGISAEASGVEELIFGITQCLNREKQLLWLRTVAENQKFWQTMGSRVSNFLHMPMSALMQMWGQACGIASYFREPSVPTATVTVENEVPPRSSASHTRRRKETDDNQHLRPIKTQNVAKTQRMFNSVRGLLGIHDTSTKSND